MAEKRIDENPRITDTIIFDIETPGADGCFTDDPYKVDKVTIYYIERDFLGGNWGQYDKVENRADLLTQVVEAEKIACENPTEANIIAAEKLRNELTATAQTNTFYYKDAVSVHVVGDELNPAWLSTDTDNSALVLVEEDENGDPQYGRFTYAWTPAGNIREGDFFICWTWTPQPAGDSLTQNKSFSIFGDPRAVITIPTHLTPNNKYYTLLERYLPDMYKQLISDDDLTPITTDKLNKSVAMGFTVLEDLANQLIDLFDANAIHESLLVYLSNLFNLKLKSNDPTLWRRQIKEAIPLFKKKGTLQGLKDAFAQAGMTLNKITRLWQVVSPYTWQESFKVKDSATFLLAKSVIEPIDPDNFGLWIRREGEDEYVEIGYDNVIFENTNCDLATKMIWIGDEKSSGAINLHEGDILKVLYQYAPIPSGQQTVEDYIRDLQYADTRDEADQEFPPKNWNVRVIEEDDPLFNLLVPVRHRYNDPLIFGKIRTEFPFSENIYNMEEYNGSTRDTYDPCLIDKSFIDPCGSCVSSKYTLDISVEDLSDDRLAEARDIIKEYTPFHSVVHNINYEGAVNEYVLSPVEEVEFLVTYVKNEVVLSGDANPFFHRFIKDGLTISKVTREQLAAQLVAVASDTGTLYNQNVSIVVPEESMSHIGLDISSHVLEVLAPSSNSGEYTLASVSGNYGVLNSSAVEPLNQSMFTFRLYNINYTTSVAIIEQRDTFRFSDGNVSFTDLGVKTLWDVDNTPDYTGDTWTVLIPAYSATPYEIENIDTNGDLHLSDPDRTLPTSTTTGISYTVITDGDVDMAVSATGSLSVDRHGLVDLNDAGIEDVSQYVMSGDYLLYSGDEYKVLNLTEDGLFYIDGYDSGDATGVGVSIKRRLLDNAIGYFGYGGLRLETTTDYEADLEILNGSNPPTTDPNLITDNNLFKENFMIKIGNDFFKMQEIDGTTIVLGGVPLEPGTAGEMVTFSIVKFEKDTVEVRFMVFDQLDRRGKDPVVREILSTITDDVAVVALSLPQGSDLGENVMHDESISFSIEYTDGNTSTGVL